MADGILERIVDSVSARLGAELEPADLVERAHEAVVRRIETGERSLRRALSSSARLVRITGHLAPIAMPPASA